MANDNNNEIPVVIHRPSILKVVLLQTNSTDPTEIQFIKSISMSGAVLTCKDGIWCLHEDSSYHDPPSHELDGSELYTLPGGIEAIYDPTLIRWYVMSPPLTDPSPVQVTTVEDAQINNSSNRYGFREGGA